MFGERKVNLPPLDKQCFEKLCCRFLPWEMPYSEQHKSEKASTAKRTRSKVLICPCKNCKSKCVQSLKLLQRHLEVFGGYSSDQFSESGSENELLVESNNCKHEGNYSFAEPSDSGAESSINDFKRHRIDSHSTSNSEQSDSKVNQSQFDITTSHA